MRRAENAAHAHITHNNTAQAAQQQHDQRQQHRVHGKGAVASRSHSCAQRQSDAAHNAQHTQTRSNATKRQQTFAISSSHSNSSHISEAAAAAAAVIHSALPSLMHAHIDHIDKCNTERKQNDLTVTRDLISARLSFSITLMMMMQQMQSRCARHYRNSTNTSESHNSSSIHR